jgi:3-hydroxyisobutyrate dehydrogenase
MSGGGTKVGFVGLGMMGWPMAHNLAEAGVDLVVRDADPLRQRSFAEEHGCAAADSPADFAAAGVVVTMLPDDRVVRAVVIEWEGGIVSALTPGSVVLDMSSSNPNATRVLAEELVVHGVKIVDAPVSGGITRAADGTLTLMIGSDDEDAFAAVEPVLEVLGGHLFRTGPVGSGHAMKALNNFVGGGTYALVVEALAVGQHYGLSSETMIQVMNVSSGRSFNTEVVMKDHVLTGAYDTRFAAALLAKDVGIAAALAESAGVEAPFTRLVSSRWAQAATALGPGADHSEAHKTWWTAELAARVDTVSGP